ncbi:MAG TPA: hypothetical protein DF712_19915 [Balneola sp.]|nr:hypothetical protein [Balneola sp.]|tara:strand:+ start:48 stop:467 length:420 start_codon:yes stop_codon:yes gene_type:complete
MPTYGVSSSYVRQAGIGNAASYQVSGRPFLTGNLDIDNDVEDKIVFPAVTKRIVIQNMADVDLRVHFHSTASSRVNETSCYFTLPTTKDKLDIDVKCTEIYISNPTGNNGKYELYAELTGISPEQMFALTGSGISGVNN